MDATTLWIKLEGVHPERAARVSKLVGNISSEAEALMERLGGLRRGASIANDRLGYVGNPYEQISEDFEVLVCVAKAELIK